MSPCMEDRLEEVPTLILLGKRTKTIQNKIKSKLRRHRPFFLTTMSLDNLNEETWFVDSWGWAFTKNYNNKYNNLLGHIKNCLEFLNGPRPKWFNLDRTEKRQYTRKNVSRSKSL